MTEYSLNISGLVGKECFTDASREELRVLLAIISEGGRVSDIESLGLISGTSRARAAASIAFWEDAGIIAEKAEDATADNVTEEYENDEEPEVSSINVALEIKNKGLSSLLAECARLMGKPLLSSTETKKIVNVYVQYSLNEEYIITLAAFLKERNMLSAMRLVSDAERLVKSGIDCTEELEIYLAKKAKLSEAEWMYKKFFAIYDRPLSEDESERAERWFCTYGYGEGIVGLAYSITTTNKGRLEIPYMDSIVTGWFNSGCKTVEDCRAENEKFKGEWNRQNATADESAKPQRRRTKEKPRYGDFDVADAFAKALERSYGSSDDEE